MRRLALGIAILTACTASAAVSMEAPVPLITHPSGDFNPAWSPDGSKLAFDSKRGGSQDVWILDRETGEVTQLTTGPNTDGWACWSPDGSTIVYSADTNVPGVFELYLIPSTGGTPTALGIVGTYPDWSPLGDWVVFTSSGHLWKVPPSGGTPVRLTDTVSFSCRSGYFAPTGSRVLVPARSPSAATA